MDDPLDAFRSHCGLGHVPAKTTEDILGVIAYCGHWLSVSFSCGWLEAVCQSVLVSWRGAYLSVTLQCKQQVLAKTTSIATHLSSAVFSRLLRLNCFLRYRVVSERSRFLNLGLVCPQYLASDQLALCDANDGAEICSSGECSIDYDFGTHLDGDIEYSLVR